MRPETATIFELFERQRRYEVPLFQRQYVWNKDDNWEPLWEDIARKARDRHGRRPHFLGAVVFNYLKPGTKGVPAAEVIDGQQRLTTFQIFLAAFRDIAVGTGDAGLIRELNRLTVNDFVTDDPTEKFKVWPTRADQPVFQAVMGSSSREELEKRFPVRKQGKKTLPRENLVEAYFFFSDAIREWMGDTDDDLPHDPRERLVALWRAVQSGLQVVTIDLKEGEDDPQIIFETLNARGVPLLPSDLLRNFLLHRGRGQGGHDIGKLYDKYWRTYDEEVAENADRKDDFFWKRDWRQGRMVRPRLDVFFFHYLQMRAAREVNITHLFQEFRDWWEEEEDRDVSSGLEDIEKHAAAFRDFLVPPVDTRLGMFARRLRIMETGTVYPLLLHLLVDARDTVSDDDLAGIIVDIESYLVRRMVCRLTTKNYNRFFLSMLTRVKGLPAITRSAVRDLLASSEEEASRWPSDKEFEAAWIRNPVYSWLKQDRVRMVLSAIDMQLMTKKQERLHIVDDLSIEHVLPVDWSAWPPPTAVVAAEGEESSEDRRNRLKHSFGNLTLLTQSLNSSVSNGPYLGKRDQITAQSNLRLNAYFQKVENWDESGIIARGGVLFETAKEIWPRAEAAAFGGVP